MPERTPLNPRTVGSFDRAGYRLEKVVYESQPGLPRRGEPLHPDHGQAAVSGRAVPDGALGQRQGRRPLSALLPGPRAPRLPGAGVRPDGPGRADLLSRLRRVAQPPRGRRGAYLPGPPDDPQGHHEHPTPDLGLRCAASTTWRRTRSSTPSGWPRPVNRAGEPPRCCSPRWTTGSPRPPSPAATPRTSPARTSSRRARPTTPSRTLIASGPWVSIAGTCSIRWPRSLCSCWSATATSSGPTRRTTSPAAPRSSASFAPSMQTLGHAERLAWYGSPLPHGLSYEMRLQIYSWFGRWLKGDSQPVTEEPPTEPEPDEHAVRLRDRQRRPVVSGRDALHADPEARRREELRLKSLERSARRDRPAHRGNASHRGPSHVSELEIEAVEFASAPEGLGAGVALSAEKARRCDAAGHGARTQRARRWHEGRTVRPVGRGRLRRVRARSAQHRRPHTGIRARLAAPYTVRTTATKTTPGRRSFSANRWWASE